jgi:regulator of sigma E protease
MNVLFYALAFVIVLGPLVFVHELGHFLAAKLFGVRVEVFSLGFGPRLLGFRRGETDYRIAPVPLGGYVRMAGEYSETDNPADPALLNNKPRWQRLVIMAAGPAVNVGFAWFVWWGLFMAGTTVADIPEGPPVVGAVVEQSPAERAGLRPGDRIVAVDGEKIGSAVELRQEVAFRPGQSVTYEIEREGESIEAQVEIGRSGAHQLGVDGVLIQLPIAFGRILPGGAAQQAGLEPGDRLVSVDGETPGDVRELISLIEAGAGQALVMTVLRDGEVIDLAVVPRADESGAGKIGAELGLPQKFMRFGPVAAAGEALEQLRWHSGILYRSLKALVTRQLGLSALSGPLEIARISGQSVSIGWLEVFALMAALSVQLGLLNLLPIPVLDGGQILLLLVEGARGRDLAPAVKEKILLTGFLMIILLMVTVIGLDVLKLSRSVDSDPPGIEAPAPED